MVHPRHSRPERSTVPPLPLQGSILRNRRRPVPPPPIDRRTFHKQLLAAGASLVPAASLLAQPAGSFRLKYIVGSCMYGKAPLAEIVPEVPRTGAEYIEIWAEPHGSQREQIDEMGPEAFAQLLQKHRVKLGSFTCFKFGIFKMQPEMKLVKKLGGDMVICNSGGPRNLAGEELRSAVRAFADQLRPHVEFAEELGITLGVENHSGGVIHTRESILQLMDLIPSETLGLAMAPYHLPQEEEVLADLIRNLGSRLVHFQAWEHGAGSSGKLTKEQERMQLPHRGPLDWAPVLGALREISYAGRTQIFMHPIPRGVPILETTAEVTDEINAARRYLEKALGT